jgi:hypothetical protein
MTEAAKAFVFTRGDKVRYIPTRQIGVVVKVYQTERGQDLLVEVGPGDYLRMPLEDWEKVKA